MKVRKRPVIMGVMSGLAVAALAATAFAPAYAVEDTAPDNQPVIETQTVHPVLNMDYTKSADTLAARIDEAQAKLDETDGRVDDESPRDALRDLIAQAKDTRDSWDERRGFFADATSWGSVALDEQAASLSDAMTKVDEAVSARDQRIAAEQAAAAAQAAAYSAQQSYSYRQPSYSSGYSGYSGSGGYYTSGSCALVPGATGGGCQGAVDGGGLVGLTWDNATIFAQHTNTGGSWINGLTAGQTVTINGQAYVVNGSSQEGAIYAPNSGTWLQTCNGNGNHLVGITPVN